LFEQGEEDRDEIERGIIRNKKLGLRQGFFTMTKSTSGSIRSLSRRRTGNSEDCDAYSMREKMAEMGTLSAAPTTRSLLKSPGLHLDPNRTGGEEV
jgi:hypothetical protein